MKVEWVERMHDQARTEMGYCVPAKEGQWCDVHSSRKPIGQECAAMETAYNVAEAAGEVMADLIVDAIEELNEAVTGPIDRRAVWHVAVAEAIRVARGGVPSG